MRDFEPRLRAFVLGSSRLKILVVEDELKAAAYLRTGLLEHGFDVETAADGESGLTLALGGGFDLVILDVMLPGRDGWSVIEEIRQAGLAVPVLFLTARDAVPDRVKGLELGADDYLVKPFAFTELLARVRTLVRRVPTRQDVLRIGDLAIDLLAHQVTRQGKRIDLTPKEYLLLLQFARRPGEILTRKLLAEEVWDIRFESDTNVVEVHIRRLRAKIDDPFDRKLIQTVRGVGYVFEEG